jgi:threonine dehydrogenase-like Zn-dependent dehydrogenase
MGVQRDGSFCEYVAMPIERIIPGMGLDAKTLALIEPFAISWHALSRAKIEPTDKVLVVGAGPIGLFALISAKLRGAQVYVSDMMQGRLDAALEYGADGVINVSEKNLMDAVEEITGGKGFDVCVEACGLSQTFLNCIDAAAFAANIILIGNGKKDTTFLHSILLKKELNVFGSRNAYTKDFKALIQQVATGKVDVMKMVSGIYKKEDAQEAFESLKNNDGSLCKLLIEF